MERRTGKGAGLLCPHRPGVLGTAAAAVLRGPAGGRGDPGAVHRAHHLLHQGAGGAEHSGDLCSAGGAAAGGVNSLSLTVRLTAARCDSSLGEGAFCRGRDWAQRCAVFLCYENVCNGDDRCQRQKQGGAVGAAASRLRVPPKAQSRRWVPQPGFR
nr:MAG TPA: hypothetical protein [Caudoviricetes sp.]